MIVSQTDVGLTHYLVLSAMLFAVGAFGVMANRKSLINMLLSMELMLLAANLNFVGFSAFGADVSGQVFAIFVMAVAAAETAVGLAIIALLFRRTKTAEAEKINSLKG